MQDRDARSAPVRRAARGLPFRRGISAAVMKRKVTRKKRPASGKPARARPARSKPARKPARAVAQSRSRAIRQKQDFVDGLMTAAAQALGLTIEPGWRDGVKFNLRLVLDHAVRVGAFPLPDDAEPAPVFHA
ncbi:MAG TPA: AtzG-like protein [Xanthobacteraceae bacterium]